MQLAKLIVDMATGDVPKDGPVEKNAAAVELGSKGGKARAKNLSKEEISEIGKKGAAKRWDKD